MKKIIFSIFALLLIAGSSCQEKIDIEKEKEAIKAAVEGASDASLKRDYAGWSEKWLQDETAKFIFANKESYSYMYGWEEISSFREENFKNNPEPSTNKTVKSNYKIKVYGKSAWANYDSKIYNTEDEIIIERIVNQLLEKVDGEWKLVFASVVDKSTWEEETEE